MSAVPSAMLTFEYVEDEQTLVLEGKAVETWAEEDRQIARLSANDLRDYKRNFRNDVRNLENRFDNKWLSYSHDPRYVCAMLNELFNVGHKFWRSISGGRAPWLWDLADSLRSHMSDQWWMLDDPRDICEQVYQIETKGPPASLLPLDALPIGEMERAVLADDEADVRLLASYFGGFSSVVRYTPIRAGDFVHPHTAGERATLFLRSETADSYDEMYSTLKEDARVLLLGPFPSDEGYHEGADIARSLLLPEPALGPVTVVPDVVHVHAHASEQDGMADLLITFEFDGGSRSRVSRRPEKRRVVVRTSHIEEVIRETERRRRAGDVLVAGPLVVFNACEALGSIGSEPISTGFDLPLNGSRAVVGPREEVMGAYAVKFSECLLTALDEGTSIGEAALMSRWATFAKYLNPSGLFYATFGDVEAKRNGFF